MKLLIKLFALAITLSFAVTAYAQEQTVWPIVLQDEAVHIGDTVIKTMQKPNPEGRTITRTFEIEGRPPAFIYVGLWISDMIPKNRKEFKKKGLWQNKLIINGETATILNKRIKPPEGPEIQKVSIQLKGTYFHEGKNTLAIEAGAKGSNLDDFEVHKILLDIKKP